MCISLRIPWEFRLEVDPGAGVALARVTMGYNPPDAQYQQFSKGHKNVAGLTSLGNFFIQKMMQLGMLIEVDHMSYNAVEATLTLAEQYNYPVVSGHSSFQELAWGYQTDTQNIHKCSGEQNKTVEQVTRIRNLGGIVAPIANQGDVRDVGDVIPSLKGKVQASSTGSATSWAQAYLYAVEKMGGKSVGIGTDTNGLAKYTSPRFGLNASVKTGQTPGTSDRDPQTVHTMYPKVLAIWQKWLAMQGNNTPLTRSYAGNRDFDINLDGVAHYGMLPDLIQDLKNIGLTDADLAPLFRSAEDYIQTWEKCVSRSKTL